VASLTGDFGKLRGAVVKLKKMASGATAEDVAEAAAPEIRALVRQQFTQGTSPYGTAWAPLAPATLKKHGPPPLTDTGEMKGGIEVGASGTTIEVWVPAPASLHQGGWRRKLKKPRQRKARIFFNADTGERIGTSKDVAKAKVRRFVAGRREVVAVITHGTGGPARPILPNGRLPDKWRQRIRKLAREIVVGDE